MKELKKGCFMNRTPLYSSHKNHAKTMTEFSGFEMPLAYEGIEAEHAHVRSRVGIFDVSHMGQILLLISPFYVIIRIPKNKISKTYYTDLFKLIM